MKALSKITIVAVLLLLSASILYFFTQPTQAQEAFTENDIFPQLVYSMATGPTGGEAVFYIRNPTNQEVSLNTLATSIIQGTEADIELFSVTNYTETRETRIPNGYQNITTGWHLDNESNNVTEWGLFTDYTIENHSVMVYDFQPLDNSQNLQPSSEMMVGIC